MKPAAHQLIDQLPANVGWDELVYRMAVRREIEKGLPDRIDVLTVMHYRQLLPGDLDNL